MRYFSLNADWFLSEGLSNPAILGSFHRLLFCEVGSPDPLSLSCVDYHYLFLFSIMSGMVALWIPRGLWTAAVMVTLVVLSTPGAEGRDSSRKCSLEPLLWGVGSEGPLGWGVIAGYCLLSHISSLWE